MPAWLIQFGLTTLLPMVLSGLGAKYGSAAANAAERMVRGAKASGKFGSIGGMIGGALPWLLPYILPDGSAAQAEPHQQMLQALMQVPTPAIPQQEAPAQPANTVVPPPQMPYDYQGVPGPLQLPQY